MAEAGGIRMQQEVYGGWVEWLEFQIFPVTAFRFSYLYFQIFLKRFEHSLLAAGLSNG